MSPVATAIDLRWWESLRHFGLLLGPREVAHLAGERARPQLSAFRADQLRRELTRFAAGQSEPGALLAWVLETVCELPAEGWSRGAAVGSEWGHPLVSGESRKPRHLWRGAQGGVLPVFFDGERTVGQGRGRRAVSDTLQWLRAARQPLALLTNGRQLRLLYAGLDHDAACEWDTDLWFEEGEPGAQLAALRLLLQPALLDGATPGAPPPLVAAILDSRRGQSELSATLGERVRRGVETLVRAHGEPLRAAGLDAHGAEVYRAAVRVVMRMVVVLFAESRELLPRSAPVYHEGYGLHGLAEALRRRAARGRSRLAHTFGAWPRVLALFRLIHAGSHHQALPVPAYGGELFAAGRADAPDAVTRALHLFESACFEAATPVMADREVDALLELLTRTRIRLRQGRGSVSSLVPVDFSDLSSEYIGILYEGLLDYELRVAPAGDAVVFLALGDEPALPLLRLEAMEDGHLRELLAKVKEKRKTDVGEDEAGEDAEAEESGEDDGAVEDDGEEAAEDPVEGNEEGGEDEEEVDGEGRGDDDSASVDNLPATSASPPGTADTPTTAAGHAALRSRALAWARRASAAGGLAPRPRGRLTPERQLEHAARVEKAAKALLARVVEPGEWYLVRWGGTRKGAGTFYTRPQLAVPLVQRTLRPLAYTPPPATVAGEASAVMPPRDAPPERWVPRRPEEILALKVCDPACGSGSFPVAAVRFLTEAVYASLFAHDRLADPQRPLDEILGLAPPSAEQPLGATRLPCRPDEPDFEPRAKALLRRYVVERTIYAVDLDPLAVELCRLALWIETMDRELPFSFLDHKVRAGNALVGAWFDQFAHYPAMAWSREGGDKNHSNGVHLAKEAWTKAIKAYRGEEVKPALAQFLAGATLFSKDQLVEALAVHDDALATLARLHDLPVHDSAERARIYREMRESPTWRHLADAFDRWCALWFWPADRLDEAPLPRDLAAPAAAAREVSAEIAGRLRFFHWELEFPDVFRGGTTATSFSGFDALIGNPPWEIAKPSSKEFFSDLDPLYRAYGKQVALARQSELFAEGETERRWLEYAADFKAQSGFVKHAAHPFGDPETAEGNDDRFNLARGGQNADLHRRWREARAKSRGFADPRHPYQHQGSADLNLYKLFLERAHALLRAGGRLGFLVPSGLYSDHGSGALRRLFLERCRWEWLFGFENREKIFDIDSRFKFNPVIVEKGGTTEAVRTAFMRRDLADWARAEEIATDYPATQITRFSPRSRAILEIQSRRDLEILETIYSNSVLLGDDGPDGWGVEYAREFDMTNDSKLFPPRPKWEEQGYRPDEYSRWLRGRWRQRTAGSPAPPRARRVDLAPGVILSRDGEGWIAEDEVEDVALPLYEGRMIGQFDFSESGWVSGKGRSAVWEPSPWPAKPVIPQFLMATRAMSANLEVAPDRAEHSKLCFMDVSSATNRRTTIATVLDRSPCGNKVPVLRTLAEAGVATPLTLCALLNSWVYDFQMRARLGGLSLNWFIVAETALPSRERSLALETWFTPRTLNLACAHPRFSETWLRARNLSNQAPIRHWALASAERLRLRCMLDALACACIGLTSDHTVHLLRDNDWRREELANKVFRRTLDPKGFWRVDKDKDPELRHTVLTLVAFHDLQQHIAAAGGDRERGIAAFCAQNDGEGWMLPETLRLADYGLGHDERAKHPQPVASRLGPRFYDWQLAQDREESWLECELHARNLLGEDGFRRLMAGLSEQPSALSSKGPEGRSQAAAQTRLFPK